MPENKSPKNVDKRSFKDKVSESINKFKKNSNYEDMYSYVSKNKRDAIAYALLILGIILLFFRPFIGELLIGIVAGLYFSRDFNTFWRSLDERIEQEGMVRSLILGSILLALLIAAPGIFIGAAIVMVIKLALSYR